VSITTTIRTSIKSKSSQLCVNPHWNQSSWIETSSCGCCSHNSQ